MPPYKAAALAATLCLMLNFAALLFTYCQRHKEGRQMDAPLYHYILSALMGSAMIYVITYLIKK